MTYAIIIDPSTGEMAVQVNQPDGWATKEEAQVFLDGYDFGPYARVAPFAEANELWHRLNDRPISQSALNDLDVIANRAFPALSDEEASE